jgi:hypothetical protein
MLEQPANEVKEQRLSLSPLVFGFDHLTIESTQKKVKDDFDVKLNVGSFFKDLNTDLKSEIKDVEKELVKHDKAFDEGSADDMRSNTKLKWFD